MNADTEIRERLERAAQHVRVDTERRLNEIHRIAPRRRRWRLMPSYAVAGVFAAIVAAVVWQVRTPNGPVFQGDVGPTGRIAYGTTANPTDSREPAALIELDPATGNRMTLFTGTFTAAQYSPDGSALAYIVEQNADAGQSYAIFVANADGSRPVKILEHPKAEGTLGPDLISLSWSPDGTQIAYSGRTIYRGRTVAIMNVDGTGNRVLDGLWVSVSWSPDGEHLLLDGYPVKSEQFDLYSLRTDGTELRRLTNDPLSERGASWSPDGTRIAFSRGPVNANKVDYEQDIYVMNADGSNLHPITSWRGLDLFPVWSRDGRWIAFSSDRDATAEQLVSNPSGKAMFSGLSIYAMRPDGSEARLLLAGGNLAVYPVSWKK